MSDHIDMKISGSSTMPGGEYGKVSISGAGKIQGNLKCDSLSCSGSGKVEGDVVTQSASCSGGGKHRLQRKIIYLRFFPMQWLCTGPGIEVLWQLPGPREGFGRRVPGFRFHEGGIRCALP